MNTYRISTHDNDGATIEGENLIDALARYVDQTKGVGDLTSVALIERDPNLREPVCYKLSTSIISDLPPAVAAALVDLNKNDELDCFVYVAVEETNGDCSIRVEIDRDTIRALVPVVGADALHRYQGTTSLASGERGDMYDIAKAWARRQNALYPGLSAVWPL